MPLDAVVARILTGLHDRGFADLVPAHFPVLRYPGPENRRPSDLAAEARMTKQAMNYLLGQMQQLGYLARRRRPRGPALQARPPHQARTRRGASDTRHRRRDRGRT